jgi:hypothetical protein
MTIPPKEQIFSKEHGSKVLSALGISKYLYKVGWRKTRRIGVPSVRNYGRDRGYL